MADDTQAKEAVEFLRHVQERETTNRAEGFEDLCFRFDVGQGQWPAAMTQVRGARPKMTVNETDAYCRQIVNTLREQRPRIKAYAANTTAQKKTAEGITGLMRHFQEDSGADNAFDLAGDFAVTIGWGYWRVTTDYIREDSMDQTIGIKPIYNPFSVYNDPNSNEPDGSDSAETLITDTMPKAAFKRDFPEHSDEAGWTYSTTGDSDWVTKDDIRIAEHFKVERIKAKLYRLSNGLCVYEGDPVLNAAFLASQGLTVTGDRESYKRKVMWRKVTAFATLKEQEWPGRWIPIVPTYGTVMIIQGKKHRFGAVRFARDPQRMVNYWNTALAEYVAMGPKAKWVGFEGFDEGHESEWAEANTSTRPVLRAKRTGIDGVEIPLPERVQPEGPPEGIISTLMQASMNLQKVFGMYDPDVNVKGPKSGRAKDAEQNQSERGNYHFYDNQTRSMKHTGRIVLDLVPKIVDVETVRAIIGDDGKPDVMTFNQKGVAGEIMNDVRVGEYGVIMEVGPGYDSKRQESADLIGNVLAKDPDLMKLIGDLWFRNMDFPGSEVIADRLAAANPMAQIDEKSDIPPQAQMQIKKLQEALQQAQQALQAAGLEIKFKTGIEEMRQKGETQREMMKQTAKAHDIEMAAATKRHDTETRALTAMDVQGLKGFIDLMLAHVDTRHLQMELDQRDRQLAQKEAEVEPVEP